METAITVQTLGETAIEPTFTSVDTGNNNSVANKNSDVILYLKNPGASSATMTITAQNTSFSIADKGVLTKADKVVTLAAGEEWAVGPLPGAAFNDGNGNLILTAGGAGAADIDVAAVRVG